MAGVDNMAEHSLMIEPMIKNEICMGKTSKQSSQTMWQERTIWWDTYSC
jgi:hypothetical protein